MEIDLADFSGIVGWLLWYSKRPCNCTFTAVLAVFKKDAGYFVEQSGYCTFAAVLQASTFKNELNLAI